MGLPSVNFYPSGQPAVSYKLPAYALRPLLSEAARLWSALPEAEAGLTVEVWPAFARPAAAVVGFTCYAAAEGQEELGSTTFPIYQQPLRDAANDLWARHLQGGGEPAAAAPVSYLVTGEPEPASRLLLPPVERRSLAEALDRAALAVGDPEKPPTTLLLAGEAYRDLLEFFLGRESEAMGSLHGRPYHDPESGRYWVLADSFLPLEATASGLTEVRIGADNLGPLALAALRDSPLLGVVHNHLVGPEHLLVAAPSPTDTALMRQHLNAWFNFSLVLNMGMPASGVENAGGGAAPERGFFHLAWRDAQLVTTSGMVILARQRAGVRSRVDAGPAAVGGKVNE
jgi:hypothetical protein